MFWTWEQSGKTDWYNSVQKLRSEFTESFYSNGQRFKISHKPSKQSNVKHGSILNRESAILLVKRRLLFGDWVHSEWIELCSRVTGCLRPVCLLSEWENKRKFSLWVQFLSVISGSLPLMMMPQWKGVCNLHTVLVWLIHKVTHSHTPWKEFSSFLFYHPSPPVTTFTHLDHVGKINDNSANK